MLFLHGILGTRANWRRIARRMIDARVGWGAILVDLREHGDSVGASAPHTLHAAAQDIDELERSIALPIAGALGHSFGGKVVLEWLRNREGTETEAWVVDASPSPNARARESSATADVLRILETLPPKWPSRDAFVEAVTAAGQPEPIAQWLAMNLRRTDDGGRTFGPNLNAIQELIEDYARTDRWDVVESLPDGATIDFVIGGRSSTFSDSDRKRLDEIAGRDSRVSVHLIEEAGHWVHVDTPDALVSLLIQGFASMGAGGT
jgi:pimeloyl-ACP methyl ester carboxylesterase